MQDYSRRGGGPGQGQGWPMGGMGLGGPQGGPPMGGGMPQGGPQGPGRGPTPMGGPQPPMMQKSGGMPPPRQGGPQMGGSPGGPGMADPGQLGSILGQSGQWGASPQEQAIRAAEQALMQAQMMGANPMELGQLQLNLQNAQRDAVLAQQGQGRGQRQDYLEAMQSAAGRGPGIGGASGGSALQQDPFLAALLANQYGQGGGGGIRS